MSFRVWCAVALLLAVLPGWAAFNKMTGYAETFGLAPEQVSKTFIVKQTGCSVPANTLWPGDDVTFALQLSNSSNDAITTTGKVTIISYGTDTNPQDVFQQRCFKVAELGTLPVPVDIPAHGFQDVTIKPAIPATFGPYALVLELPGQGRQMAACCVRVPAAAPGKVQYPSYAMDLQSDSTEEMALFKRLGVKGVRKEMGYKPTTSPDYLDYFARIAGMMKALDENNITVMITSGGGGPQPMGMQVRPYVDDNGVITNNGKGDMAWLPSSDDDFQQYIKNMAGTFGWPKGPLNAIELWNEPWEGRSISGWGADMLRYRELYTRMAQGIEAARKENRVQVLIGGTCSSMNTFDKLFGDNTDTFLPWLDFTSIHYQPLGAVPALVPEWMTRKSPYGPVRVWDTESWVANSEDRVAAVIASMRAQGQSRTAGVFHDVVREVQRINYQTPGGAVSTYVVQALAPAAGIAASQHFIGERPFKEIVFPNGLPWVFRFDGLPRFGKPNPDDSTLVVVGDLGGVYDRDYLLFRSAHGVKNNAEIAAVKAQLAALPADAPAADRTKLTTALKSAEVLHDGVLNVANPDGQFILYDFYGNPQPAQGGTISVPLNGLGFFLRSDGTPGSFAKLLDAVKAARLDGLEPLDVAAHDLTARVETHPALRLTLTNVLNRPVKGTLAVKLGALTLDPPTQDVALAANETKVITCTVTGGAAAPDNSYPLALTFDAGADGTSARQETLHVNAIAKRTITVDGKLDDWKDVLPQPVAGKDTPNPNLTEKAWFPFEKLDTPVGKGFAIGYLAYDDANFYFAAKIADNTPSDGGVRFATRDDDAYFYPEKSLLIDVDKTLAKKDLTLDNKDWTWSELKKDGHALQTPDGKDRVVGGWEALYKAFAIDLNLTDGKPHQVTLYGRDGESMARRSMHIEIIDPATNKVLAKQDLNNAAEGKYAVFNICGNVRIKFSSNNWLSTALNGIFFDPVAQGKVQAGTAANFVKFDDVTFGNWLGVYGADGCNVIGTEAKYPAYAQVTVPDQVEKKDEVWPEGVRRFSYRKAPDLPSGSGTDNVLLAFNVLPITNNGWYPNPPGTMPRFMNYRDTNYEYALNKVSPKYGGGTEIWRLFAPGMVRKHFFPRQPKGTIDGGAVDGKLAIVQDAAGRVVECAIPWTELPDVKKKLDAGELIKFSFRVNDNGRTPAYELAMNRSVSKLNNYAFHNDWESSWANEVEFGFEK